MLVTADKIMYTLYTEGWQEMSYWSWKCYEDFTAVNLLRGHKWVVIVSPVQYYRVPFDVSPVQHYPVPFDVSPVQYDRVPFDVSPVQY